MRTLINGGRLIAAIAAAWATGASLFIFFAPIETQHASSKLFRDSTIVVETFAREQSWYETQGLWGVVVLVVFAGLYLLAARLAWAGNHLTLALLSLIALALSVISGFSIGGLYLPAACGLLVAAGMLLASRRVGSQ